MVAIVLGFVMTILLFLGFYNWGGIKMKVKDFIKYLKQELQPYNELDIDNDWLEDKNGISLSAKLEKIFKKTDLTIRYWWDFDN